LKNLTGFVIRSLGSFSASFSRRREYCRNRRSAYAKVRGTPGRLIIPQADIPKIDKVGDPELTVLLYELKADLNAYLARLGPKAPVRSLADVIRFNLRNKKQEMPFSGRTLL
jgi:hypothetical protein